jgi:DNA-binding response OmpR family regulator
LSAALEGRFDLIILDIMLPGMDGFSICKRIRTEDPAVPIIILTAKTEEVDKIVGLEMGADDYITKPFSPRELAARIKAVRRRSEESPSDRDRPKILRYEDFTIDEDKRTVVSGDSEIELTAKEFELLLKLAKNPGRPFTREQLLEDIWGYRYDGYSHTVNSHINRLRNKIEPVPSEPKYIETVWGYGYRFRDTGGE